MHKIISIIFLLVSVSLSSFSQGVKSTQTVKRVGETNEYNITTTITGLQGVDIARINYMVSDKQTYKPSPKNTFFSDRNAEYIRFYIMGVPNDGKIVIYLGIVTQPLNTPLNIPIEFQYSKNEEKQTLALEPIVLEGNLIADNGVKSVDDNAKIDDVIKNNESPKDITEETTTETSDITKEKNVAETTSEEDTSLPKEAVSVVENTKNQPDKKDNLPIETAKISNKFTVQILALAKFSQNKLTVFCKQHNLLLSQISKKQINGLMKIRYGVSYSKEEARKLRTSLLNKGIIGAFVVGL